MRLSASQSRRTVKGAATKGVTFEGVAQSIYMGMPIRNGNSVGKKKHKDVFWPAIELVLSL